MVDINEIKDFIISNYPYWQVNSIFRHGVNHLISDENYTDIDQKIKDYELFYNFDIENKIIKSIKTNIKYNFKIEIDEYIYSFIVDYMCGCIPSFKRKLRDVKDLVDSKWYDQN